MGLPSDDATVPGVTPLRRLTRVEYQNTIRDLLGAAEIPAARLAAIAPIRTRPVPASPGAAR